MKLRLIIAALSALFCLSVSADDTRTISGESTYYGDDSTTPREARQRALEQARLDALAKAFGTTVTGTQINDTKVTSQGESTYFKVLNKTDVRGEWVNDIGEPVYKISYDSSGNVVVHCKVRGLARKLSNKAVDFEAMVLRNGKDPRFADTRFNSGDDFRLYFKSPVDGYVAVYLIGDDRMAYTLLPYSKSGDGSVKVEHGREYVFFDTNLGRPEHGTVDEIAMMTDKITEHLQIYVLFSPHPFVKANDSYRDESTPRSLPFNDFYSWLERNIRNDASFSHKIMNMVINGKAD